MGAIGQMLINNTVVMKSGGLDHIGIFLIIIVDVLCVCLACHMIRVQFKIGVRLKKMLQKCQNPNSINFKVKYKDILK